MRQKEGPLSEAGLAWEKYIFPAAMTAGFASLSISALRREPGQVAIFGLVMIAWSVWARLQGRKYLPMDRSVPSSVRVTYWWAPWFLPLGVVLVIAGFVGWLVH